MLYSLKKWQRDVNWIQFTHQECHCFDVSQIHVPMSGLNRLLLSIATKRFVRTVPLKWKENRIVFCFLFLGISTEMVEFYRKMTTYFDGVFLLATHISMISAQSSNGISSRSSSLCIRHECSQEEQLKFGIHKSKALSDANSLCDKGAQRSKAQQKWQNIFPSLWKTKLSTSMIIGFIFVLIYMLSFFIPYLY